ncbi:hypothetical protein ruthe_02692 [Rubellimicrobium thermophilum DSM 16684]|uniref:Uncharacterized protein n=1 Tax=Rubellimicrobium thermophilum DSM 16684 TaxID=1123069 RepID=S9SAW9_9RHOB|nr:hypothetical protein ruthe_02692 [Rubellimicrobium thermophilum DSM 16684]
MGLGLLQEGSCAAPARPFLTGTPAGVSFRIGRMDRGAARGTAVADGSPAIPL